MMKRKVIIFVAALLLCSSPFYAQDKKNAADILAQYTPITEVESIPQGAIYADKTKPAEARVQDLISRLTFEEKVLLTGGWNGYNIRGNFNIPGIERLGIRAVTMADAGQGVRKVPLPTSGKFFSTSFPSMLALTSTWNPEMARDYGSALGEECRALGIDILLGPGMNFQRVSTGGRNFEFLGEDPILGTAIVTEYILGLQSTKTLATPKHFVANEQEFVRHIANSVVGERALHEIYLRPWKSVIRKAGAKAIMTGNNWVNGLPCAINKPLIADILRDEYGFDGIAMTDWQNTNYAPSMQDLVVDSGISLLMPSNGNFVKHIKKLKSQEGFDQEAFERKLDKMVYHNLLPLFEMGVYDRTPIDKSYKETFDVHKEVARACAEESIILLKNENDILPLEKGSKSILLTGVEENHSGRGSGYVAGYDHTSYAEGLQKVYGQDITYNAKPAEEEVRSAETVIFILDKPAREGRDIPYAAPEDQLAQLRKVLSWNDHTIVIVNASNTMPMDWAEEAKGILWSVFLGQERGNAMANIIAGKVNPSGKLAFSIERDFNESVAPEYNYLCGKPFWRGDNSYKGYWLQGKDVKVPGFSDCVEPGEVVDIPYNEDIFIGYRWYDKHDIPLVFPFGYGLSYTKFRYSDIEVDNQLAEGGKLRVSITVKNTGKVTGKAVAQLYISDMDGEAADRPEKELKDFDKIELKPGASRRITFELSKDDFAIWDVETGQWKVKTGTYEVKVGSSSQDLKKKVVVKL